MKMKRAWVVAIGLCAGHGIAASQPVAEKPDWKVGDRWEFRQTTTPGDQSTTWSHQITDLLPENRIRVKFGNGTLEQYDAAFNFIPDGRAEFIRILAQYPLKVGDQWTYTRKFANPALEEKGTAKVVTYESITVPAGTFDCYRVDIDASFNNKQYSEQRLWQRWYCPKVKWIAKERLETRVFQPRSPGTTTVASSELAKFTPGE